MPSRCPPSLAPSSGCPQGPLTLFTGQQRPCSSRGGAAPGGGAAPKRGWFGECGVLRPEWLPASWRRGRTSPRSAPPRTERGATRPQRAPASGESPRASNGRASRAASGNSRACYTITWCLVELSSHSEFTKVNEMQESEFTPSTCMHNDNFVPSLLDEIQLSLEV